MNSLIYEYKTSHISLAAYLKVLGYDIISIEKNNGTGTFVFKEVSRQDVIDFNNEKGQVEPNKYHQTIKQLINSFKNF